MTNMIRAAALSCALAIPMASTSSAQPPVVIGGGLVNVQIGAIDVETGDILSDNVVGVNVNAAVQLVAQICGLAVLAEDVIGTSCSSTGDQIVRFINVTSR